MSTGTSQGIEAAGEDDMIAVLEGFHALKHAVRFGAEVIEVLIRDFARFESMRASVAPELDLGDISVSTLPASGFRRLAPGAMATGVVALARRPRIDGRQILNSEGRAPVVLLENTRRLENMGACIRVAAAAGAAGVVCLGENSPWHRAVIRGAAGLQFALPVARLDALPDMHRPIIAFDAAGEPAGDTMLPGHAIYAFGTEREGLTPAILAAAERRVRIPMRTGVSSINIAAAVAVALYGWRGLTA
jgi:TrmH family RNA methyltransferase